ncbi:MAG: methionine ABC transporter ATP-binding protein [Chlamydiota bacterium]
MITVEHLYVTLGERPLLKNLSFHVEQGTIFGIVGPSGAGKSTLFRSLCGLTAPSEGHIRGTQKIGIVFQHFPLLSSRTVLENVELPLIIQGKDPLLAQKALDLVGLSALTDRYPAQLSGGQKQKAAIARALVGNPDVLLLDEPSSALDPQSTKELQELLLKLNKQGLTIILITHEMDLIRALASSVLVMDQGEIVEIGPLVEVFGNPVHAITKSLLEEMHPVPTEELTKDYLRLSFRGTAAKEPLISQLIKLHDVEINIFKGSIDTIQTELIGELFISLTGPETEKAITFLESKGVHIERFGC